MEMDQNETPTCGLYIKASRKTCNSIQNAVFHGSTSHNAQSGSTNPHKSVIPQLTLIIALGILPKGIQVREAAQWQPDRYCGKTDLPLGFEYKVIERNRPQLKDRIKTLRVPLSGTLTPDEEKHTQTSGVIRGEETPRAGLTLS
jgi:hypothetical protein